MACDNEHCKNPDCTCDPCTCTEEGEVHHHKQGSVRTLYKIGHCTEEHQCGD